jgi:Zn-dependent M16 (insulinase) family peptidase
MLGAMTKWLYDESPTEGMKFEAPLAALKAKIDESGSQVFQDMIKQYLIENSHRSTIEMVPSKTLESEQLKVSANWSVMQTVQYKEAHIVFLITEQEEVDRLVNIKSKLSDTQLEEIMETTKKLKELQAAEDTPEERATVPSLEIGDLKREVTEYPIAVTEDENNSGITVLRHELGSTSGIAYGILGADISRLSVDDIPLLPLFTRMMMETGAGEYDQVALSRQIGMNTGGIGVSILTTAVHPEGSDESQVLDGNHLQTKLIIKGKATSNKTKELFSLMKLIMTDAHLDSQSRVIAMLKEQKSRTESGIRGR